MPLTQQANLPLSAINIRYLRGFSPKSFLGRAIWIYPGGFFFLCLSSAERISNPKIILQARPVGLELHLVCIVHGQLF